MGKFLEGLADELTLFVRQSAWLSTVPKAERKPGLAEIEKPDDRSRAEKMRADGVELPLPEISAPWIYERLMEIGPIEIAGMDRVPISWATIRAWRAETLAPPAPWESRLLRRLSAAWLTESRAAEKPDCPAPWTDTVRADQRVAVVNQIRAIFGRG